MPTDELLGRLPTPQEVRLSLSAHLQAVRLLRELLRLSERLEAFRAAPATVNRTGGHRA